MKFLDASGSLRLGIMSVHAPEHDMWMHPPLSEYFYDYLFVEANLDGKTYRIGFWTQSVPERWLKTEIEENFMRYWYAGQKNLDFSLRIFLAFAWKYFPKEIVKRVCLAFQIPEIT
jgi:hypothetical protein